jgi:anti-sigma regulatory factor (Ser/Thr protein kinase)
MADNILELTERRTSDPREWIQSATFPRQAHSAPLARHFVTEAIGRHPAGDDAVLLTSELITNVLVHARDATVVTVIVTVAAALIRVDVHDDGQTGIPHWREAGDQAEDGRGFQIVNALAQRWGFTRNQGRTCCWFEVTAAHAA